MNTIHRIVACIASIAFLAGYSTAKEWRGITPLHSTRIDVLRILGPTNTSNIYNLENEVVLISYSSGNCDQGGIWNVPRDTVIRISITPKKTLLLKQLHLKLSDYEVVADKYLSGFVYYNNSEEGVHIQTFHDEVTSIDYLPTAKENYLRCVRPPVGLVTKQGTVINSHTLFDAYIDIPFDEEKARLDLFGSQLLKRPEARGYIAVYSSPEITTKQLLSRADRAKKYLIKKFSIKEERIEILSGEQRKKMMIELYLEP